MSIATLKRKTVRGGNPRLDPVSGIGAKGFSLNGGYRNIGAVGQFRMVSNVTRTPFRGTQPMGHGGFNGEYYDVPSNSGSCCTNDDAIIKHSSLNTAGMLDEKYKWTKSQYPNYWVKDDNNSYRITKTQGQLTGAKTWAAGACNFQKAANNDPNNVWQCNGNSKCVYWIGGKKRFLYYPYAKWLNTTKVQSQGIYIKAGGVALPHDVVSQRLRFKRRHVAASAGTGLFTGGLLELPHIRNSCAGSCNSCAGSCNSACAGCNYFKL